LEPTSQTPADRLDSWKAIADYLKRDVATVRRWEKSLGLPVRRVPGDRRGRSVFAYRAEIDAWLERKPTAGNDAPPAGALSRRWRLGAAAILAIAGIAVVWSTRARSMSATDLRVVATDEAVIGLDRDGNERWRHLFSADHATWLSPVGEHARVVYHDPPAVFAATSYGLRRSDDVAAGGELIELDLNGRMRRRFGFDDRVLFDGTPFGAPWAITTFAVHDAAAGRRIAAAAHHYTWEPSVVTVLDEGFRRLGTFVHAGWIEALEWVAPNRLLIGGYSQAHEGGMVALIDPAALDGQGPEPPGTRYFCTSCGPGRPIRMAVMPRTEVNRVTASRFNRAIVELTADRIIARTIEVANADFQGAADVVYEFTHSLDLQRAAFSDRYRRLHDDLAKAGKLDHTFDACPDRDGPREILTWAPAAGWEAYRVRP
jgi:hypothetical protein